LLTLQLQLDWKKGGGWREVLQSHLRFNTTWGGIK
jgi:hypothetical protein